MSPRPVLTALLVAGLAVPAAASSWICSDPEAETLRQELIRSQETIMAMKAEWQRRERAYEEELSKTKLLVDVLQGTNRSLEERVRDLKDQVPPPVPEQGWAQAIEELRRDGDVNVGLTPILDRMTHRGLASHRIRHILHRLSRYDGVLEAALETPAPEHELERFGVILDKVERHADSLARDVVRRLEKLQAEYGDDFSPRDLDSGFGCELGFDDDLGGHPNDDLGGFEDDFGDF
jgi:hypothetical protein